MLLRVDHIQVKDQSAFSLPVHVDERCASVDTWLRLAQARDEKLRRTSAAIPLEVVNGILDRIRRERSL